MKKQILTLTFLISCIFGFSQEYSDYPNFIGQDLKSVESHPDWKVLKKASGDVNKDGLDDVAIILESKDSIAERRCGGCYLLKTKPRIILVLLHQKGKKRVIIQNHRFIARGDEGGMAPYIAPELSIENKQLKIYYQYTRSNQSYTFEFKEGTMEIVSAEGIGVRAGDFESEKYDFKKREIIITTGHISKDIDKTETLKIHTKPQTLSEFIEMYEWGVAENCYL